VIYDDVYADPFSNPATDFLGDVRAESDDATVTVDASNPSFTQFVRETVAAPDVSPLFTQFVREEHLFKAVSPLFTQFVREVFFGPRRQGFLPKFVKYSS